MRYFVNIGSGDDAYTREIEFEERAEGLWVKVYSKDADDNETLELEQPIDVAMLEKGRVMNLHLDTRSLDLYLNPRKGGYEVACRGDMVDVDVVDERERLAQLVAGANAGGPAVVEASMPGVVVSIECELGQEVDEGSTLIILEAMKMQNPIAAEGPGKVEKIFVEPGQSVAAGEALIELA
jgi:acetyl/propionyl-CoA carboxylase alpha subunit